MTNQVQNNGNFSAVNFENIFTQALGELENLQKMLASEGLMPDGKKITDKSPNPELPSLPAPPASSLSLETLINAIGFEQRRTNCKAGLESIEAKAEQQKANNEKQLEEIAKQLDKMAEQKVANIFKKIFGVIGAIIGVVASAVTIAAGAMTGNPLLMVAGAMGAIMAIDSVLSTATDGKISLSAGFTELGKAMGMSDDAASKFALGMQIFMTVATIALSFGAGFASSASSSMNTALNATKTLSMLNKAQQGFNIANGVVSVGQGASTIASTVIQYETDKSKIRQKELEAVLERIRQAIEMEKELLEAEMERSNDLLGKVHDIVQEKNATQTAILTGTPNFA